MRNFPKNFIVIFSVFALTNLSMARAEETASAVPTKARSYATVYAGTTAGLSAVALKLTKKNPLSFKRVLAKLFTGMSALTGFAVMGAALSDDGDSPSLAELERRDAFLLSTRDQNYYPKSASVRDEQSQAAASSMQQRDMAGY